MDGEPEDKVEAEEQNQEQGQAQEPKAEAKSDDEPAGEQRAFLAGAAMNVGRAARVVSDTFTSLGAVFKKIGETTAVGKPGSRVLERAAEKDAGLEEAETAENDEESDGGDDSSKKKKKKK